MSLWKIAWRSIQERALSSMLTALSISLGVALVVAVLAIHNTIDRAFRRGAQGYDLIVGAKGGQLPLVLSTVSGTNSKWTNNSYFYVGNSGSGTLSIAGGSVSNAAGYIAYGSASTGAVDVSGTTSRWSNSGSLTVGYGGAGTLSIADGGTVSVRNPDKISWLLFSMLREDAVVPVTVE
jgi:T5SS/PEP-CTERM-associated repeat protein